MDKKSFLEEMHYSDLKNRRKKNLIYLLSLFLIIFLIFSIHSFYSHFYSNIFWNKFLYKGIENSFLYTNNKKAERVKREQAIKLFTHSFIVKNVDILNIEQWNLFLETVPFNFKIKNKEHYQIYGFLNKNQLNRQVNELLNEKIIKNFSLHAAKINKELLK